jgi:hypothetical protein
MGFGVISVRRIIPSHEHPWSARPLGLPYGVTGKRVKLDGKPLRLEPKCKRFPRASGFTPLGTQFITY